jgi:hypothetical protein
VAALGGKRLTYQTLIGGPTLGRSSGNDGVVESDEVMQ